MSDAPHTERLAPGFRSPLSSARRADPARLEREIRAVSESPVVTAVLEVADAVLLVLDPDGQIVGFNSRVAEVKSAEDVLGLRAGEALGCENARGAGGCGTALACTTCGALGAILGCQARGRPVESDCVIPADGTPGRTLEFNVRAAPVVVDGTAFTVVSLRDVSSERRREALEQVFFHDVLNTVAGLRGWADRLQRAPGDVPHARERIGHLARQVEREIQDHRALLLAEQGALVAERAPVRISRLLHDLEVVFSGHPVARDRSLELGPRDEDAELVTDRSMLLRVLVNMVRNALEATAPGGVVHVRWDRHGGAVRLSVHNAGAIEPHVQARIFQRSFSTKAVRGRGLGTYSMKLFGERYLGGAVSFVSTPEAGTVFSIRLAPPTLPVVG